MAPGASAAEAGAARWRSSCPVQKGVEEWRVCDTLRTSMNRFVHLAFVSALAASLGFAAPAVSSNVPGQAGLQLWSLRETLKKDVAEGHRLAAKLGFKDVETAGTWGQTPEKYAAMLREAGLNPISGHFGFDAWAKDPEAVVKEAKALGVRFAGVAWISHEAPFKAADVKRAAEVFNRAGAACAKAGITFFYHVHGYEFHPNGQGGTLFDDLVKACDPKKVSFQMDTTWVYFPGQDPAALLRKYPGRWCSLHLKDLKKGVERGSLSGGTDHNNDVPIGQGQLDWPGILRAAKEVGVQFYIIEDESDAVVQQLPKSVEYLRSLKL